MQYIKKYNDVSIISARKKYRSYGTGVPEEYEYTVSTSISLKLVYWFGCWWGRARKAVTAISSLEYLSFQNGNNSISPTTFQVFWNKICFTSEAFSKYLEVKMSEIEIEKYKIFTTFFLFCIYFLSNFCVLLHHPQNTMYHTAQRVK